MDVYVEEFLTAGGCYRACVEPTGSLATEGLAMVQAVVADLLAVPGVTVTLPWDVRLSGRQPPGLAVRPVASDADLEAVRAAGLAGSDAALLIAPECDGEQARLTEQATKAGAWLLSPDLPFVRLAGDKNRTAEVLAAARVPVPEGWPAGGSAGWPPWPGPCVVKPSDGAGCIAVVRYGNREAYEAMIRTPAPQEDRERWERDEVAAPWRVERWIDGTAASCLVLMLPGRLVTLPAASQAIVVARDRDGERLAYRGGRVGLPAAWDGIARSVARQAVAAIRDATGSTGGGLVGVDLVLTGNHPRRAPWATVIEVNPRLTTSYIGVRRSVGVNLLAALIDPRHARDWPDDVAGAWEVAFAADGSVGEEVVADE